jgi:hypothetical protein
MLRSEKGWKYTGSSIGPRPCNRTEDQADKNPITPSETASVPVKGRHDNESILFDHEGESF